MNPSQRRAVANAHTAPADAEPEALAWADAQRIGTMPRGCGRALLRRMSHGNPPGQCGPLSEHPLSVSAHSVPYVKVASLEGVRMVRVGPHRSAHPVHAPPYCLPRPRLSTARRRRRSKLGPRRGLRAIMRQRQHESARKRGRMRAQACAKLHSTAARRARSPLVVPGDNLPPAMAAAACIPPEHTDSTWARQRPGPGAVRASMSQ
jgi:hypothetical protein